MGPKEFAFYVVGAALGIAFSWAVSVMCAHPNFAVAVFWISGVAFGLLGPLWAYFSKDASMTHRLLASISTMAVAAIALPVVLWQGAACAQTANPPSPSCLNSVGGNNSAPMINNCTFNLQSEPKLEILGQTDWKKVGESYEKDFGARLINPGAATMVKLVVFAKGIMNVGFFGEGMMGTGEGGTQGDMAWLELLTPTSIRGFSVHVKAPTVIDKIDVLFH